MTETLRTIGLDVAGGVATLTLNRPERMNAYTAEMGVELFHTLRRMDTDDSVRAIIVTGAGRAFCAGADLAAGGATFAGDRTWEASAEDEAACQPWRMRKPVIAAFNGAAVGVGATLPLQWDIRIASENAKIGFVFVRRGIIAEANAFWLLPRLVGVARAAELLLTGRILSAQEALEFGLVSRVVPHEALLGAAHELARDIAQNTAPVSVAVTKQLLWRQVLEPDPVRAKQLEEELFTWFGKQPDVGEGIQAFLEKRDPKWRMSPTRDLPTALTSLPPLGARKTPT